MSKKMPSMKRKNNIIQRRWLDHEVKALLTYLRTNPNFERPTAKQFYNRFLSENDLNKHFSWELVKWKVKNLRTSLKRAKDFEQTHSDSDNIHESPISLAKLKGNLLKICPLYVQLNEIFVMCDLTLPIRRTVTTKVEENEHNSIDMDVKSNEIPSNKIWTNELIGNLLNYLIDNQNVEKPNDQQFYETFLLQNDLWMEYGWDFVHKKVRALKRTYLNALDYENAYKNGIVQTREGVSVDESLNRRFPHFDKMKQLFGVKKQTPPDIDDSDNYSLSENDRLDNVETVPTVPFDMDRQKMEIDSEKHLKEIELNDRRFEFEKQQVLEKFALEWEQLNIKKLELEMNERLKVLEMEKNERIAMYEIEMKYKHQSA